MGSASAAFARDHDRRLLRQLSSGDSAASAMTLAPETTARENRGRRPHSIVDELRVEGKPTWHFSYRSSKKPVTAFAE